MALTLLQVPSLSLAGAQVNLGDPPRPRLCCPQLRCEEALPALPPLPGPEAGDEEPRVCPRSWQRANPKLGLPSPRPHPGGRPCPGLLVLESVLERAFFIFRLLVGAADFLSQEKDGSYQKIKSFLPGKDAEQNRKEARPGAEVVWGEDF